MTSGDEIRTSAPAAVTRRAAGAAARSRAVPSKRARTPGARWSRRRGVVGAFAGLAVVGFAAAYIGPAGLVLAEPASAQIPTTVYATTIGDAQSLTVSGASSDGTIDFDRHSYSAYETPEPEPEPVAEPATSGSSSGSWTPPFVSPDPGSAQAIAYDMVLARGWGEDQFACLVALWNRESGWRVNAYNASSGAYGIPQSLPGNKMASAGEDWATNPATQITWGLGYISGRYGAPCGAWDHSNSVGWY